MLVEVQEETALVSTEHRVLALAKGLASRKVSGEDMELALAMELEVGVVLA